MKLSLFEFRKLLGRRYAVIGLLVLFAANLFFLSITAQEVQSSKESTPYIALMQDLRAMTTEQKKEEVRTRLDTVAALIQIERHLLTLAEGSSREPQQEFIALYEEYGSLYESGSYRLYTGDLRAEVQFLTTVRSELETVAGYPDFLAEVKHQAELYTSMPIFSQGDAFSGRNVQKTAADYAKLDNYDIEIEYFPQRGLLTAITFEYTDLFILASMLLLAGSLIVDERDKGLLRYIKSMPGGHTQTAGAKCAVLLFASLFLVLILYTSNMVYCAATYGLGNLGRSIQSLPFLMRSVLPLRVLEYLILFFAAKWMSVFLLGMGVMVIVLCAKKYFFGILFSVAVFCAHWAIYTFVPLNGMFSVVKYVNFVGILKVNEWLGGYLNFNILQYPVSIFSVVVASAVGSLLLLLPGFVFLYAKTALQSAQSARSSGRVQKETKPTTLFREEAYKTFVLGGGALLLSLLFIFQMAKGITANSLITAEEIYYSYFMQQLSGPYTQETHDMLMLENEAFTESREMDKLIAEGKIDAVSYNMYYSRHFSLYQRRAAFDKIVYTNLQYVVSNPGAWLIYETGYDILFDRRDVRDLSDALLSGFLLTVCLANVFSREKQSGMDRILDCTPLGRRAVSRCKINTALLTAAIVTIAVLLPRYIQVIRDFGLPAFFAPAKSLVEYAAFPSWIRVCGIALFQILSRFLANAGMSVGILYLSKKTGNMLNTIFAAALLFCLVPILALFFLDVLKMVTLYPLFAVGQMLAEPQKAWYTLLMSCNILLFGFLMWDSLQGEKEAGEKNALFLRVFSLLKRKRHGGTQT